MVTVSHATCAGRPPVRTPGPGDSPRRSNGKRCRHRTRTPRCREARGRCPGAEGPGGSHWLGESSAGRGSRRGGSACPRRCQESPARPAGGVGCGTCVGRRGWGEKGGGTGESGSGRGSEWPQPNGSLMRLMRPSNPRTPLARHLLLTHATPCAAPSCRCCHCEPWPANTAQCTRRHFA